MQARYFEVDLAGGEQALESMMCLGGGLFFLHQVHQVGHTTVNLLYSTSLHQFVQSKYIISVFKKWDPIKMQGQPQRPQYAVAL